MKPICLILLIHLVILPTISCGAFYPRGLIYTHTVSPLDINASKTPIGVDRCEENVKHFGASYVSFSWDENAIGEIFKKSGLETIYFADIEIFSFLVIWNQYTVHIYGE